MLPSLFYFLCAPKFVRFLLVAVSFSLSSWSFFLNFVAFFPVVVEVGVAWFEPPSRTAFEAGVTCEAGVEPPEPGVMPSYVEKGLFVSCMSLLSSVLGISWAHTRLFGLYDIEDREKTLFCSTGPTFRLCAAAPLVPFM